ncbi:alcohol dehydrogenase catalytic domain-containing protein [Haloarcula nitratireducens]|uniref:Alcohol dehydrogenase catalytic domain-containing protein n=1 Tax=Haloarcula nitratireducens TaxID=2487749 RepID=A0AAW4PL42_9EURY|nr:alcohol dehydrogenase catalytic domain-containing protein [Halomicroarcula nitratireducens]MBX0298303.1 alcohol dehydrogenase catalytic domain-containing protein [Halomicroarcula nitratireducens]
MQAVVVEEPDGEFQVVERDVPDPGPGEVRVAVEACGICHSDAFVKEGTYPGISYPRVPGHEIAGRIDAVGDDVTQWTTGDRVGVGWHGGHCFTCEPCRRGNFLQCENGDITGVTYDGGYAEYVTIPTEAVAGVPEDLAAADAAPLLCAGVTTYNALRNSHADPGDLVAVQGVGGLGHLGVQYAHAAGFETVALSRSPDKEDLARDLGADHFVNTAETDPAERLQELGGADVVLATAPASDAIESVVGGLGIDGRVVVVGVPGEPVAVNVQQLVGARGGVEGWASGHAQDSQDTLEFSALREVTPEIETYPLAEVDTAYERMIENEARFRVVLEP